MRRFIDIISEAPISNYELMGDPNIDRNPNANKTFDTGTSFDPADQKLLNSTKGITKVVKAFSKTPHDFEVFFANTDAVDATSDRDNEDVDHYADVLRGGIHDEYGIIKGKPGVIRVVAMGNLSPNSRMPMTGWTLAHKIGHSIQDELSTGGWLRDTGELVKEFNTVLVRVANLKQGNNPDDPKWRHNPQYFSYSYFVTDMLTMKSQRDNKINSDFEVFAELVAQYLVRGAIELDIPEELRSHEAELNAILKRLFDSFDGKVMVEI